MRIVRKNKKKKKNTKNTQIVYFKIGFVCLFYFLDLSYDPPPPKKKKHFIVKIDFDVFQNFIGSVENQVRLYAINVTILNFLLTHTNTHTHTHIHILID